jgi:hypothetical protein
VVQFDSQPATLTESLIGSVDVDIKESFAGRAMSAWAILAVQTVSNKTENHFEIGIRIPKKNEARLQMMILFFDALNPS